MPFNIQRTRNVLGVSKTIYYVSAHNWTDQQENRAIFSDRASAEALITEEVWKDSIIVEE